MIMKHCHWVLPLFMQLLSLHHLVVSPVASTSITNTRIPSFQRQDSLQVMKHAWRKTESKERSTASLRKGKEKTEQTWKKQREKRDEKKRGASYRKAEEKAKIQQEKTRKQQERAKTQPAQRRKNSKVTSTSAAATVSICTVGSAMSTFPPLELYLLAQLWLPLYLYLLLFPLLEWRHPP